MNAEARPFPAAIAKFPRRWVIIFTIGVVGLGGLLLWQVRQGRIAQREEEQAALAPAPEITTVTALGRLEPRGEIVNLTPPTSVQESRIERLLVDEGDQVEAGQVIAILDNRDRLQATLQQAEQQVQVARARLAEVEAGAQTGEVRAQQAEISRLEADRVGNINSQQATIARLEAEVQNASAEYQRYESLYQRGAISESERDTRLLTLNTSQRQLEEARAALARIESTSTEQISQARATLDRIEEVRPVDVQIARAEVDAALATVAEAQANLDQASVKSPVAGQVIEIFTRAGETVGSEGIATLGQTSEMLAIAEVYQGDIARVEPGQSVTISTSVLDEPITGTVESIGLQIQAQQVINEDPTQNIDAEIIEVNIRLDDAAVARVKGFTNLQVTTTIETE